PLTGYDGRGSEAAEAAPQPSRAPRSAQLATMARETLRRNSAPASPRNDLGGTATAPDRAHVMGSVRPWHWGEPAMKVLCVSTGSASRDGRSRRSASGLVGVIRRRLLVTGLLYLLFALFTLLLAGLPTLREAFAQVAQMPAASSAPQRSGASAGL